MLQVWKKIFQVLQKIMQNKGETMKFERLFEQLKYDEGVVYEIYKDHLGYPTFVGHLVLESDPEYGQPVGTPVSEERVEQCFDMTRYSCARVCSLIWRAIF